MSRQIRPIAFLILICCAFGANSEETTMVDENSSPVEKSPLFYRGGMDDRVVTVDNGARVNRDYASFIENGPWRETRTWAVRPGVHTITGRGLSNFTFIEGDTGLILFDTGVNDGMGLDALKMKAEFSDKPISAIIYSHWHYTGGTHAIRNAHPGQDIPIYGHPKLDENMRAQFLVLSGASRRRGAMQMGYYLPESGPDAFYAIDEPLYEDPMLERHGHVAVTNPVGHGEKVTIDGLNFVFYHAVADTDDSLIVHVPALDVVLHNAAVMPFLFPLYTLRGDYYRSVPDMIDSIDLMRRLRPEHLIGCHGVPVSGKEAAYDLLTTNRDAFAYLFQRTIQGINAGMTPDELAVSVRLPKRWADYPGLFPAYVDVEHIVRGIYRGLIGWWAEDSADLHPPVRQELDAAIVEGFGGSENIVAKAREAFAEKKYNLTASLLSSVLTVEPDNASARRLKAKALRRMAQATPTGVQSRSFFLTEALHLEGALDRFDLPGGRRKWPPVNIEPMLSQPPGTFVGMLQYRLNADVAGDLNVALQIDYTDLDRSFGIAIRHGAVEYMDRAPERADIVIETRRRHWVEVMIRQSTFADAVEQSRLSVSGDAQLLERVLAAYAGTL